MNNAAVGISPQQLEKIQQRLAQSRRAPAPVLPASRPARAAGPLTILGIDPSLRGTGYGVLRAARACPEALAYGTIRCPPSWPRSQCLLQIAQTLRQLLKEHRPDACVLEGLFYAQNFQTALIMGEARGASLTVVAEAGVPLYEIAPRKVKQAIVGYGAAHKRAVARMIQQRLHLERLPAPDAADALAVALAHAQENGRFAFSDRKL